MMDPFESLSPLDYRYWDPRVASFLSEKAFLRYKLKVETSLAHALARQGVCSQEIAQEIQEACKSVTMQDVYAEERRVKHDLRAMVNCIQKHVSDEAKPYVHLTATSYDISDTANILRYRDLLTQILIPELIKLEDTLVQLSLREAKTVQVGRTHGQHAVPITFGFSMSGYVSRLGESILQLKSLVSALKGKCSGAVGAYNASSLLVTDPEQFERDVLAQLNLEPAEVSTQIIPAEPRIRLFTELVLIAGILADLSDDMRHLQRSEISEIGERFDEDQVGSSTMPQKRNPITFENAKSMWKIILPRLMTVFMDQLSEHQRDLTNSASSRTYGEVMAYVISVTKRLSKTMPNIVLDKTSVQQNVKKQGELVLAEPLYIILASLGHPDAHEAVRRLTQQSDKNEKPLLTLLEADEELQPYLQQMTGEQKTLFSNPSLYTGIASEKSKKVAMNWKTQFGL